MFGVAILIHVYASYITNSHIRSQELGTSDLLPVSYPWVSVVSMVCLGVLSMLSLLYRPLFLRDLFSPSISE